MIVPSIDISGGQAVQLVRQAVVTLGRGVVGLPGNLGRFFSCQQGATWQVTLQTHGEVYARFVPKSKSL